MISATTGKDDIGAVMTEVAINRLNALLDEPVEDPSEQALRADAGNMLLETYQRRTITTMTRGRMSGWSWLSAPLEKYMQREVIIAQRQELFRLRRAHNISDITFMRCCGR